MSSKPLWKPKIKHRVFIAEIKDDVIIGMDIMNTKGFKLDFRRGILMVSGEEMVLHHSKEEAVRVVLVEDVVLPERSEVIVAGNVVASPGKGSIMMFEPKCHDNQVGRGVIAGKWVKLCRSEL